MCFLIYAELAEKAKGILELGQLATPHRDSIDFITFYSE